MSAHVNAGGPAFPCPEGNGCAPWDGMTLRDWFAGQALSGVIIKCHADTSLSALANIENYFSERAYLVADAMIAEREKGGAK